MTLTGHEGDVNVIYYSQDGLLLASGSKDGTVRIWDMRTGEEAMVPLRGDDGSVWAIVFSPNGRTIFSGTESGVVCIWYLLAGHATSQRLTGHAAAVLSVAYSSDGSLLASASRDTTLRLWRRETGDLRAVLRGHTGAVNTVAFSPDGQTLASGSDDGSILLWHSATGNQLRQALHVDFGSIRCICFSPDGKTIAGGSSHGVRLWKSATGKKVMTLRGCSAPVLSIRFSADGDSMVAVDGKQVCIWTMPRFAAKATSVVLSGYTDTVLAASLSPDDLYIASAGDNCSIQIWNAGSDESAASSKSTKSMGSVKGQHVCLWTGHKHLFNASNTTGSTALLLDGVFTASASEDGTIRIWNAGISKPAVLPLTEHAGIVTTVAASAAGAFIVSGSVDRTVRVWDTRTGATKLPPLSGHTSAVSSVTVSSDGRLIASGSQSGTVKLWNAQTGAPFGEPNELKSAVTAVSFSPNAQWLASGSGDEVCIWDVGERQTLVLGPLVCSGRSVYTVSFSPTGKLIAAGCDDGIDLWDLETGQPVHDRFKDMSSAMSIACSPDEQHIVSCGREDLAYVCRIDTGQRVFNLVGHADSLTSVAYSPDGRIIGTGSLDCTVRLWSAATGLAIAILHEHTEPVYSVTFIPNMQSISSQATDKMSHTHADESPRNSTSGSSESSLVGVDPAIGTDNWQMGPFGELLLWVPETYRQYLLPSDTSLKARGKTLRITIQKSGWHRGENWTSCWLESAQNPDQSMT